MKKLKFKGQLQKHKEDRAWQYGFGTGVVFTVIGGLFVAEIATFSYIAALIILVAIIALFWKFTFEKPKREDSESWHITSDRWSNKDSLRPWKPNGPEDYL